MRQGTVPLESEFYHITNWATLGNFWAGRRGHLALSRLLRGCLVRLEDVEDVLSVTCSLG